jgi:hypothetical protein
MNDNDARDFADVVFGDKDLMTYRNGKRALTRLVMEANRLDRLNYTKSDDNKEARGVVEDLLTSPVMRDIMCVDRHFAFRDGKLAAEALANLGIAFADEPVRSGKSFQVRDSFKVPRDDTTRHGLCPQPLYRCI